MPYIWYYRNNRIAPSNSMSNKKFKAMKAKNLFKGLVTVCVLFLGLNLNASLGEMTVWGFTTYGDETISDIQVSCPNSAEKSLTTDATGFYQFTKVSDRSTITFQSSEFGTKSIQVLKSEGLSQRHDCDFSSSSN